MGSFDISIWTTLAAAGIGLLIVILFYAFRRGEDAAFLSRLGVGVFLLKAALVPVYFMVLMTWGNGGFAYQDGIGYHDAASEMATELKFGLPHDSHGWKFHDPGYNYLGAVLFWLLGPNPMAPRMLNAAATALTLFYVFQIAMLVWDDRKTARLACYLAAFLPYSALVALDQRKDAVVQLMAMFLLYHAFRILRSLPGWGRDLGWLLGGLIVMYYLRSSFILPFAAAMAICFLLAHRSLIEGLGFSIAIAGIVLALLFTADPDSNISIGASVDRLGAKVESSANLATRGGLARFARIESIAGLYKLPLASLFVLIFPFPPRFWGRWEGMAFSWTNLPYIFLLPGLAAGVFACFRGGRLRERLPILVYPAIFVVILALTHFDLHRYRETFSPALFILMAGGLRAGVGVVTLITVYGGLLLIAAAVYLR